MFFENLRKKILNAFPCFMEYYVFTLRQTMDLKVVPWVSLCLAPYQ